MKKLLFTAYDLNVGGIEVALITLLKSLNNYDITLVLERKQGAFLDQIPNNVKVIEYRVSESKNVLFRKIYNRIKLILFILKIKNKYDFSASFATYSIPGANIALNASKNNYLWIHGNYYKLYDENEEKLKVFLDSIKMTKFKGHVYVSSENRNAIIKYYNNIENKAIVCNNLIDYEKIIQKSKESINIDKKDGVTFVNIGRHEESQKRLTRILKASKKLKEENYKFNILFVGDGPDHEDYKKYVLDNNLNDIITFVGKKKNPYPYYLIGDAVILSSYYEGFPVVFLESMILKKTIISTKVSDWEALNNKYGIFVDNNDEAIYYAMKQYLDSGFKINVSFDPNKYNKDNLKTIERLINNR